ncbi:MAG: hypothetical protein IJW76_03980 [Clostridia bacterium]|nr:hypothetical protein [Clostridia bacterium]
MKDLIRVFDNFPWIVKILLAIFLDVVIHIYRVVKAVDAKNTTAIVVSIILFFVPFMGLIDLIYILVKRKYWSMA